MIQEKDFDVIVADLRMPGIGSRELFQMSNESSLNLGRKFVFMTGDSTGAEVRRSLESAGNPVLNKPFGLDEIHQLIRPSAK